jgi:hypothetical protein
MKDGKFEIGDRVRVKKPDKQMAVGWPSEMDIYDGGEYVVTRMNSSGRTVKLKGCALSSYSWNFDVKWLTLVGFAEGTCPDCGSEMKDVQLLTSTTKICPKCEK